MADKAGGAPAVNEFEAGADVAGQLCSICQTHVIAGERVVNCPQCALPFHSECWQENRGCSAYGCEGAPKTEKAPAVVDAVSNAWADEKPCPSCGKTIKSQALKCRFCGASFETRDVISREDFISREYDGLEYTKARNQVVLLFLLSAAGCLSPLGLIVAVILVTKKECLGIDYRRLPATLKAIVLSSIGLSALLLVIMAALAILD